jgi:hypothetical protein
MPDDTSLSPLDASHFLITGEGNRMASKLPRTSSFSYSVFFIFYFYFDGVRGAAFV